MLTPREKFPLPEGSKQGRTREAASRRIASLTHDELSYSGPLISNTLVILTESQSHPKWYEMLKFSDFDHHTKFKRNQFVNVFMQANV